MQRITDTLYTSGRSQRQPQKQLQGLYEQGYAHTFDFGGTGVKRRAIELTISQRRQEELNTDFNGRDEGVTAPEAREDADLLFETLTRIPGIPAFILQAGRRKTDVEVLNVERPAGSFVEDPSSCATNNPSNPAPESDAVPPHAGTSRAVHRNSSGSPPPLPFPFPNDITTVAAVPSRGKLRGHADRHQSPRHHDIGGHPYVRPHPPQYNPPILEEQYRASVVGFVGTDNGWPSNGDNTAHSGSHDPISVVSCATVATAYGHDDYYRLPRSHIGWSAHVDVAQSHTGGPSPASPQAVHTLAGAHDLSQAAYTWGRGEGRPSDDLGRLDEQQRINNTARGHALHRGPYHDNATIFEGVAPPQQEQRYTQLGLRESRTPDDGRTPSLSASPTTTSSPRSLDETAMYLPPSADEIHLPVHVAKAAPVSSSSLQDGPRLWTAMMPSQMAYNLQVAAQDSHEDRRRTSSLAREDHREPTPSEQFTIVSNQAPMVNLLQASPSPVWQEQYSPPSWTITADRTAKDTGAQSGSYGYGLCTSPCITYQDTIERRRPHISTYSALDGALAQPELTHFLQTYPYPFPHAS